MNLPDIEEENAILANTKSLDELPDINEANAEFASPEVESATEEKLEIPERRHASSANYWGTPAVNEYITPVSQDYAASLTSVDEGVSNAQDLLLKHFEDKAQENDVANNEKDLFDKAEHYKAETKRIEEVSKQKEELLAKREAREQKYKDYEKSHPYTKVKPFDLEDVLATITEPTKIAELDEESKVREYKRPLDIALSGNVGGEDSNLYPSHDVSGQEGKRELGVNERMALEFQSKTGLKDRAGEQWFSSSAPFLGQIYLEMKSGELSELNDILSAKSVNDFMDKLDKKHENDISHFDGTSEKTYYSDLSDDQKNKVVIGTLKALTGKEIEPKRNGESQEEFFDRIRWEVFPDFFERAVNKTKASEGLANAKDDIFSKMVRPAIDSARFMAELAIGVAATGGVGGAAATAGNAGRVVASSALKRLAMNAAKVAAGAGKMVAKDLPTSLLQSAPEIARRSRDEVSIRDGELHVEEADKGFVAAEVVGNQIFQNLVERGMDVVGGKIIKGGVNGIRKHNRKLASTLDNILKKYDEINQYTAFGGQVTSELPQENVQYFFTDVLGWGKKDSEYNGFLKEWQAAWSDGGMYTAKGQWDTLLGMMLIGGGQAALATASAGVQKVKSNRRAEDYLRDIGFTDEQIKNVTPAQKKAIDRFHRDFAGKNDAIVEAVSRFDKFLGEEVAKQIQTTTGNLEKEIAEHGEKPKGFTYQTETDMSGKLQPKFTDSIVVGADGKNHLRREMRDDASGVSFFDDGVVDGKQKYTIVNNLRPDEVFETNDFKEAAQYANTMALSNQKRSLDNALKEEYARGALVNKDNTPFTHFTTTVRNAYDMFSDAINKGKSLYGVTDLSEVFVTDKDGNLTQPPQLKGDANNRVIKCPDGTLVPILDNIGTVEEMNEVLGLTEKKEETTNETRTNEAPAQSEQAPRVAPSAGEEARPMEAGEAPSEVGGEVEGGSSVADAVSTPTPTATPTPTTPNSAHTPLNPEASEADKLLAAEDESIRNNETLLKLRDRYNRLKAPKKKIFQLNDIKRKIEILKQEQAKASEAAAAQPTTPTTEEAQPTIPTTPAPETTTQQEEETEILPSFVEEEESTPIPEESKAQVPIEETAEQPKQSNKLRRKKGGQEKSEGQKFLYSLNKSLNKAKAVYDKVRTNDATAKLDPFSFRKGRGNTDGLSLKELKELSENVGKEEFVELGLTEQQAEELVSAIQEAYAEQNMAAPNASSKAENEGKVTYSVGAMKAIDTLRRKPNDARTVANALRRVSDALEAAKRKSENVIEGGDMDRASTEVAFWEGKYVEVLNALNALSKEEQDKVIRIKNSLERNRDTADNKNTISRNAGANGDIDIADSNASVPGELVDVVAEHEQGSDDAARLTGEETMQETYADEGEVKASGASEGGVKREHSRKGNNLVRVSAVDKDFVTIELYDVVDEDKMGRKRDEKTIPRAMWSQFVTLDTMEGEFVKDSANPQVGDTVRMAAPNTETKEERDKRFAQDKNYQTWLKHQKANDAEKMRERYEQEGAQVAANLGRNFIGGVKKVDVVDRPYIPAIDGGDTQNIRDPKTQQVVGTWNRKTQELTLFRGANASTLVHELGGHAAYQFAQEQAAKGDKTLLNKMNECIDYALTNPKMKPLIDDIRSRYPEATEEVMRDEIFAALMERNSPIMQNLTKTLQGKAWYNRAWQAIKEAFKSMLTKMGLNKADMRGIDNMQPEEFMSWLDRTMAEGKNLGSLEGMDSQIVDNNDIMFSRKKIRKADDNELHLQRNQISEQEGGNGLAEGGRGRFSGNRTISEISRYLRGSFGAEESAGRKPPSDISKLSRSSFQTYISQIAPKMGEWIDDISTIADTTEKIGSGNESDVYMAKDGKFVIKLNKFTLIDSDHSPADFIEGIDEYNKLFPHLSIRVIGFAENSEGEVCVVIRQPYVRTKIQATQEQIGDYFKGKGFAEEWQGKRIAYKSEEYTILDAEPRNVLVAKNGLLYPIDLIIEKNKTSAEKAEDDWSEEYKIKSVSPDGKKIEIEQYDRDGELLNKATVSPEQIKALAKRNSAWAEIAKKPKAGAFVRRATAPAGVTTRASFMDDKQTKGEKLKEDYIDSTAPIERAQKEVDMADKARGGTGVEEVVNPDGSTDWLNSTDYLNARDKENGHLERARRELETNFVKPMMETLAKAVNPNLKGKDARSELVDDFNIYLQCRHAEARNRKIANDKNETYTDDYYQGMGMITRADGTRVGLSKNEADRLLADMRAKYGAKFTYIEQAAQYVYDMLAEDLDNRYEAGLLSSDEYVKYLSRRGGVMDWGTYVPLKDDLANTFGEHYNSFSQKLKRNEFMKAKGRGEMDVADSPLAAAILQYEQGLNRASKNILANVEANLVAMMNGGFKKNGITDFSKTERIYVDPVTGDQSGAPIYAEVVEGVDERRGGTEYRFTFGDGETFTATSGTPNVAGRSDIHLFKRDGKLYAIRYPVGANGLGRTIANAFSGDNISSWGDGMGSWIPKTTRWLSAMRTQYSLEFVVTNMMTDNWEAFKGLVGKYGIVDGGKVFGRSVRNQVANSKDLWHYVSTGEARGVVKKAIDAGLLTKGGVASQGIEAETNQIKSDLAKFIRQQKKLMQMRPTDMAKSAWDNAVDFISIANSFAELSTRIGIFDALEHYNVPTKDAIKYARDATVNFNRKGAKMPIINGLYMFANASIQGLVRTIQALRDDTSAKPKTGLGSKRILPRGELTTLLVLLGVSKAVLDSALGGDEDDEKNAENQSEYERRSYLGIPIGGNKQLTLLRERGLYAAIPYLAQTFTRVALGKISIEDAAKIVGSELSTQLTEVFGGNGILDKNGKLDMSLIAQSLSPTMGDLIVQLLTKKDFKGDNINRKSFDDKTVKAYNGKDSTSTAYKAIAKALNWATGGDEIDSGKINMSPEEVKLIVEFIGGGPFRDLINAGTTVSGGSDDWLKNVPVGRRLVRNYPDNTGRYYDATDSANVEKKIQQYREENRLEKRKELREKHPWLQYSGRIKDRINLQKELLQLEKGRVKQGNKWVEPKQARSDERKAEYKARRLKVQAEILKLLGK